MMTPKNKPLALVLCLALGGCSTVNPPTFLSYIQPKAGAKGATAPNPVATPTDAVALKYANEIEVMYRRNATGARITREGSDTGLAGIAAVTGAAKSLAIGASGLSSLGLASGGIVALRTIFDAKGRSTAYEEAAERIHGAIKDYVAHNLNDVPSDKLTPNGWTLANVVQSND